MAITVTESMESRETSRGKTGASTRVYIVKGTADESAALVALAAATPDRLGTGTVDDPYLPRQTDTVTPKFVDTSDADASFWEGKVSYGRSSKSRGCVGDVRYSFDTTGGTEHIVASIATRGVWTASGEASSGFFDNLIGVGSDGSPPSGVDIPVALYKWDETHYLENAYVTGAYKAAVFYLTARINASRFRDFDAGEVMFMGVSGGQRGEDDWELTFRFAARPNQKNIAVGDITGIHKAGWDYLWVIQKPGKTVKGLDGDDMIMPTMAAVITEQVSRYGDFSVLGIGT